MDIKMRITGVGEVLAKLRYITQRVPDGARKKMRSVADHIVEEAKLNAPEDSGDLVASIRKEVTYGGKGRLQIDIVAGGNPKVDRYVAEVHENYEGMVAPSKWGKGPSPRTKAKRAANPGRYVGEKFLERAIRSNEKRIPQDIFEAVMAEIPEKL